MMITGKWIGQYTYGEGYSEASIGKPVPFELDLRANGTTFEGTFTDDESKHLFTERGIVEDGFLENNAIVFSKRYPCFWTALEDGTFEVFPNEPSHVIYYSGTWVNDHFEGEWEILAFFADDDGPFTETHGAGTWTMEKARNNIT